MKTREMVVIVSLGLFGFPLAAQTTSSSSSSSSAPNAAPASSPSGDPKNLLIVNPGDLFNGLVTFEYERALGRFIGIEFGMSVLTFRGVFNPPVRANIIAIAPEVGVRVHLIRAAPRGLWFGPSINAAYLVPNTDAPARSLGIGFGAAIGYNFTIGNFVFQLGVGGAVNDYGDGFVWSPRLRLGLGAVF
jgi:hypothetical protein